MWRIFCANSSGPRRPSPSLAGRTTSRRCVSKLDHRRTGRRDGGGQARRDGGDGRIVGRIIGGSKRVVDQLLDPGELLERGLRLEAADRPAGMPDEARLRGRHDRRQALEPSGDRRQAGTERGELAGLQREQAVAEQVDPVERVPGLLAQLGLREQRGLELADQQVAIDRLVAGEIGHGPELAEPAVDECQALGPPGLGQVRPAVVVGVVADVRRPGRIEAEELAEEGVDAGLKVGHRAESIRLRCI